MSERKQQRFGRLPLTRHSLALALAALYVLAITSPVLVAFAATASTHHHWISEIAKNCGLVGIGILLLQFVLAGRFQFISGPFGLDSVLIFHRTMGIYALGLLLAHPVLMAAGESKWELLYGFDLPWHIWAGKATLLLLLLHVFVSVFRRSLQLTYERWRIVHDTLAVGILVFALIHSVFSGGDLETVPMRVLWGILGGVAMVAIAWHRLIRPRRLRNYLYRVSEIREETHDVWTLQLEVPAGMTADHLPGQFHFLTFLNSEAVASEEHHFTISSSPTNGRYVESTIKESGDFTRAISHIQTGDLATVHGSFGRFSYVLSADNSELVFISGGIGITPLMSMLRHMRDTESERPVMLIYANKTESDIVFREELEELVRDQVFPLRVVHVLSNPSESWSGERGHVDGNLLTRVLEGTVRKEFYICGPAAMTKEVVSALRRSKVPRRVLHTESFSLLKDTAPTSSRSLLRKRLACATIVISLLLIVAIALVRASGSGKGDVHEHTHSHSDTTEHSSGQGDDE